MTATCRLCGSGETKRLFESRDRVHGLPGVFTIHRCGRCAALFIDPWLGSRDLALYYPERYGRYRHSRSLNRKGYTGIRRFVLENYYHYPSSKRRRPALLGRAAAFLLSFVMARDAVPYRGEGRFLDVGCGGGSYLYRLKQWGWEAYGVEPSERGVKQARALGLDVRLGELAEARFQDGFFDVVRLNNVLEHLTDPEGTLREVRRIVKPQGVVYITVPNTRSLNFWLFGPNWYGLDAPRHVISYCPRTLKFLCDAAGFKVADLRLRSGVFNFVRSMQYLAEEKGRPGWLRRVDWPRNKIIRRGLKPFFFFIDVVGLGDMMVASLARSPRDAPDSASRGGAARA